MPSPSPKNPAVESHHEWDWAQQAMAFMEQHHILPGPDAYALIYMHTSGTNTPLSAEIEEMLANKLPFSQHVLKNLQHKYVIANANERAVTDMTVGANRVLGEVLRVVSDFSHETSSYNHDIDNYMEKISVDIEDHSLQGLIKDLISTTAAIRNRGESLNMRLEESRTEIESLKKNLDHITNESQRDFLTGIYNRRALDKIFEQYVAQAAEQSSELSVLMLDIDHFKQFNDKFGHLLGDEVLKIVARAITYCVRGKDIVARYGGEEFCVLLPGTPLSGAMKVADTIRTTIAMRDLKRKDTGESFGSITVSVGAAQFRSRGEDDIDALVKRADDALYRSKMAGRNRVTGESAA